MDKINIEFGFDLQARTNGEDFVESLTSMTK